jgi:hypothetical protein
MNEYWLGATINCAPNVEAGGKLYSRLFGMLYVLFTRLHLTVYAESGDTCGMRVDEVVILGSVAAAMAALDGKLPDSNPMTLVNEFGRITNCGYA